MEVARTFPVVLICCEPHNAPCGLARQLTPSSDCSVAGTSCVDYSPLNTKQKKINEKGESGAFLLLPRVERR